MAKISHDGLSVCIDCTVLIANDEGTDEHRALMQEQWEGYHLVLDCPEECEGYFSWSQCHGCGSTDGGDRHPAVAFPREDNNG